MTDQEREMLLEMDAVRELLEEEREQTAVLVCDWVGYEFGRGGDEIASLIRARKRVYE